MLRVFLCNFDWDLLGTMPLLVFRLFEKISDAGTERWKGFWCKYYKVLCKSSTCKFPSLLTNYDVIFLRNGFSVVMSHSNLITSLIILGKPMKPFLLFMYAYGHSASFFPSIFYSNMLSFLSYLHASSSITILVPTDLERFSSVMGYSRQIHSENLVTNEFELISFCLFVDQIMMFEQRLMFEQICYNESQTL